MTMESKNSGEAAEACFETRVSQVCARPGFFPYSIPVQSGQFLRSLVRLVRPQTVVELGTFRGVSTLWLAQGLKDIGSGRLYAYDLFEHSDMADVDHLIREFSLQDWVEIHHGDSVLNAARDARRWTKQVDLLWIDADHRDLVPGAEITAFWPHIADDGLILLHDIHPTQSGWDGPRYALDMLRRNGIPPQNACLLELSTEEGYGIGIIQKRTSTRPPIIPALAYWLYQWRSRFRFWLKRD